MPVRLELPFEDERKYDPPNVDLDSRGTAIDPLLRWLKRWAESRGYANVGIEVDEHFGPVALMWLQLFQVEQCLVVNRTFDKAARAKAKRLDGDLYFDYVEAASESGTDITEFTQLNSSPTLFWCPGCEPNQDREVLVAILANIIL